MATAWGVVDMQGWRKSMEDAHVARVVDHGPPPHAHCFGVFDGHGGPEVARFCALYWVAVWQQEWRDCGKNDCGEALRRTFHRLDRFIDDPARREELIRLRAIAPEPGEQRELEPAGDHDDKPPATSPPPVHSVTPVNSKDPTDGSFDCSNTVDNDTCWNDIEMSLSTEVTPEDKRKQPSASVDNDEEEGAIALKISADSDDTTTDEEVDSIEAAGGQEAAELDEDLSSDDEEDEVNGKDFNPLPSPSLLPAPAATSMFHRLLNLSVASGQVVLQVDSHGNVAGKDSATPSYRNPNNTAQSPPTLVRNGEMFCNLPDHPIHAGATAIVAVLQGHTLTVANAGDSRAVLCRAEGVTKALSFDHKPMQTRELNRIRAAGGFVNAFGRVNGNLNLSRSIGDLKYKQVSRLPPEEQMITAEPDIVQ